jgi:hypothetical protein
MLESRENRAVFYRVFRVIGTIGNQVIDERLVFSSLPTPDQLRDALTLATGAS